MIAENVHLLIVKEGSQVVGMLSDSVRPAAERAIASGCRASERVKSATPAMPRLVFLARRALGPRAAAEATGRLVQFVAPKASATIARRCRRANHRRRRPAMAFRARPVGGRTC
jgi:hypothetical protein